MSLELHARPQALAPGVVLETRNERHLESGVL